VNFQSFKALSSLSLAPNYWNHHSHQLAHIRHLTSLKIIKPPFQSASEPLVLPQNHSYAFQDTLLSLSTSTSNFNIPDLVRAFSSLTSITLNSEPHSAMSFQNFDQTAFCSLFHSCGRIPMAHSFDKLKIASYYHCSNCSWATDRLGQPPDGPLYFPRVPQNFYCRHHTFFDGFA